MGSTRRNVVLGVLAIVAVVVIVVAVTRGDDEPSASAGSNGATKSPSIAGKRVCFSSPGNIDVMNQMFADIDDAAETSGNGVKIQVVDGEFNAAKQLEQATQFLAGGQCAAIGVVTTVTSDSASAWQSLATQAKDKNIVFSNFSADWITDAALNISNPHCPGGRLVGEEAAKWYKAHGATGAVGVITAPRSPGLVQRTKCFEEAFKAGAGSDVKIYEAANDEGKVESSAAAAGNLLQAHPDITVFFGWGADTAIGVTQAAKEGGKTDPDKFFVGAMDLSTTSLKLLMDSKSVLQAGTVFDFPYAGVSWEWALEGLLLGNKVPPTGVALPVLVTKDNAQSILDADAAPTDPANKDYFAKAMVYCDEAVETGAPFPDESSCAPWEGGSTPPKQD